MESPYLTADQLREQFANALSQMYQTEVPQYGTLLNLVRRVNQGCLNRDLSQAITQSDQAQHQRLELERHGAIRLGSARELATMRQLFAVMGMQPVSYYDLSGAGLPVHATAFRPVDEEALAVSPLRIFTSLLRLDLIANGALRQQVSKILARRQIFTPRLLKLLEIAQQQSGLDPKQACEFIEQALKTFRWQPQAIVDLATYQTLLKQHPLLADIVCFKGPHINHLTPSTLDIEQVHHLMPEYGLEPKPHIEGPPSRQVPILLRQTSFKALSEVVKFRDRQSGHHRARFGEVEQRGLALTPRGRALYDRLLAAGRSFAQFPDDLQRLRQEGLGYFRYGWTSAVAPDRLTFKPQTLEALIARGEISVKPILYEDFLPISAAGIFQSNLVAPRGCDTESRPNQEAFERALGCRVVDEFQRYAEIEQRSLDQLFS